MPSKLPTYDEMKATWATFGDLIEEVKSDGKVTFTEGLTIVVKVAGYLAAAGKLFVGVPMDEISEWAKKIVKSLYHDKSIGIDVDIPIVFEPAETWFEDTLIDTIVVTVVRFAYK